MVFFSKLINLRPYGKSLLAPDASVWLTSVGIIIYMMCTLEGVTWGIISTYFIPQDYHYFSFVVGAFLFLLILVFDITLVNTDWLPDPTRHHKTIQRVLSFFISKMGIISLIRTGMIAGTIAVTIPLLTHALLTPDIDDKIKERRNNVRQEIYQSIQSKYKDKILQMELLLSSLTAELTKEIAGAGPSRTRGDGPVAESIRTRIEDAQRELKNLKTKQQLEMTRANSSSLEVLANIYGKNLPIDSYPERRSIAEQLASNQPEKYQIVTLLADLLMLFIFATMLILKLFQPISIGIYQNGHLQDKYKEYLKGGLDEYLADKERPNGISPMTPHRFYHWVFFVYKNIQHKELRERTATQIRDILQLLNKEKKSAENNYNDLGPKIENLLQQQEDIENQLSANKYKLELAQSKIDQLKKTLAETDAADVTKIPHHHRIKIFTSQDILRKQLSDTQINMHEVKIHSERLLRNLERIKNSTVLLEDERKNYFSELKNLDRKIATRKEELMSLHDNGVEFAQ